MSERDIREHLEQLLDGVREQLRPVLEECRSSAHSAPPVHRLRPDGTFDTDVGSGRKKREFLHKDIFSKLHQLSGAVGELSSSLISHKDMHPPRESMTAVQYPGIVVCGPPGTEPTPGISNTRLDHHESVVYSRSSTSLSSEPSPFHQYVVPLKDTERELFEVEISTPSEQDCPVYRRTRARTSMFQPPSKVSYVESDSESSSNDSDMTKGDDSCIAGDHKTTASRASSVKNHPALSSLARSSICVPSPAISEDYETAKEDLSGASDDAGAGDDKFFTPAERLDVGSRGRAQEKENKVPLTNGGLEGSGLESDDSSVIESSGIYSMMKELAEHPLRAKNNKHDVRRNGLKRIGALDCGKELPGTQCIPKARIAAVLRHQPVLKISKVALTNEQLREAQKIVLKSIVSSGPVHVAPQSVSARDDGEESNDDYDVAVGTDHTDHVDPLGAGWPDEARLTPKSSVHQSKRALSLSLPRKGAGEERVYSTPQCHGRPGLRSSSSAKRILQYSENKRTWSSDSDFDTAIPTAERLSQQVRQHNLSVDKRQAEGENELIKTPKRKRKVIPSYSSGEEEVTPLFLQKQKAARETQSQTEVGSRDASLTPEDSPFDQGDNENVLEERSQSSGSEAASKPQAKLGKYEKSPRGKGKEKATRTSSLPAKVSCAACNKTVIWKTQKIHIHPRLQVLVCQKCHDRFNLGSFEMVGENEIYCTLCGDGGNIVLCSFCKYSFCQDCIKRHSGEKHLKYLLSSSEVDFKCYMCDPKDIRHLQTLSDEVCYYFSAHSDGTEKQKKKNFKSKKYVVDSDSSSSKSQAGSSDDNEYTGSKGGVPRSASGSGSRHGSGPTDRGEGTGESSKRHGRNGGRSRQNKQSRGGDESEAGAGKGSSVTRKSQPSDNGGNSSSDTMSDVEDSSDVNTDDITLSDTSIFGDDAKEKDKGEGKKSKQQKKGDSGAEGCHGDEDKQTTKKKKSKKKKRIIVGRLETSSDESDIDSAESAPAKERRKKRKHSLSDYGGDKPMRKKNRLGSTLSSGSSDEERLAVHVSDVASGEGVGSSSEHSSDDIIRYRTPVKVNPRAISDSSDSDVVPLKRKNKKDHSRVLSDSSVGKDSTSKPSTVKVYKTRSRKRKKKGSGKGSNGGSSDDFASDDLSLRGPRFKHKRLRLASFLTSGSSSSDSSDSESGKRKGKESEDTATPSTPGKKRKNIRKLIADDKLAVSTRTAQKEEEERIERLKKKAKLLAPLEDSERVILEQDVKSKEIKLEVRDSLVRSLKPHQKQGIKFLYDSCVESLERLRSGQTNGAILAHCMGLGKTLQVITFVDALLNCEESGIKRVLILTPINAIHNWIHEFRHWIPLMECDYGVHILRETDTLSRLKKLRTWYNSSGVILIGYEMYRNLAVAKKIRKQSYREELSKYLLDPGPDVIVCDEGHVMRNSKSNLSMVLGRVRTRTRIVLTGTPLQNNLLEYYTMVNFVKPNLLGTQKEFTNRFANPIKNGQCRDSNPLDIRKMKMRAHILHELLRGSVQRRDYRVLAETLPPKQEYVLNIRMSPVQDKLYRRFLDQTRGVFLPSDLFSTYHALSKVWNHPWVLKLDEDRQMLKAERAAILYGLSDDDETLGGFIVESSDDETSSNSSTARKKKIKTRSQRKRSSTSSQSSSAVSSRSTTPSAKQTRGCIVISSDEESEKKTIDPEFKPEPVKEKSKSPPPWYDDLLPDESINKINMSGKLLFLLELLKEAEKIKEKVLVFTQSLLTLDLIEEFLGKEENGGWTPALDYYRLDGSTNAQMRMSNMTEFNKLKNSRLRLFLISTRAGSLGVNLIGANRVVIFDACWNPSHDLQAIFRTYRYGQTKPIFVYRLLAQGTMEEKIYDRQVTKESLSMRVVDEKQIGRHFTASDLAELFAYSPAPPPDLSGSGEGVKKPEEDMVLSSILEGMHPEWIVNYHKHDSLLEHVFDEELSEEERKAAWENYNAQKSAETARYNIEALQTKLLRDEELQRAAMAAHNASAASSISQLAAQVGATQQALNSFHHNNTYPRMASNVVMNIDRALSKINHLQRLQHYRDANKAKYSANPTPSAAADLRTFDTNVESTYTALSRLIQFANESIIQFNHSPAAQVPHLLNVVSGKRQELNRQLEVLKSSSMQQAGSNSSGGAVASSSTQVERNHESRPTVLASSQAVNIQGSSHSVKVGQPSSQPAGVRVKAVADSTSQARAKVGSDVKEKIRHQVAASSSQQRMREMAMKSLTEKTRAPQS